MTIALSTLTTRLENMVAARDSVPGDYAQIVKDAVSQLAQDVPIIRYDTISVVSGTATYTLADDFLYMIELESALNTDGIIISDSGLIPVSDTFDEVYEIVDGQITFTPTPTYTVTRDYRYCAGYVLDGSSIYQNLSENAARIALLYAQYLALNEIATSVAGGGWKYSIGDESVDKSRIATGYWTQADRMLTSYQQAIKGQKTTGMRARYNVLGQ